MMGNVEILTARDGCWGRGSWLYVVECDGRRFQISIVSLTSPHEAIYDSAYWAEVSELRDAGAPSMDPHPIVERIGITCDSQAGAYEAATRVITRLVAGTARGAVASSATCAAR